MTLLIQVSVIKVELIAYFYLMACTISLCPQKRTGIASPNLNPSDLLLLILTVTACPTLAEQAASAPNLKV